MLTDWAGEIFGKFLANIFISADAAAPDSLALCCLADGLGLRLDILLVVVIRGRGNIGEHLHLGDETNEEHVSSQIDSLFHVGRDKGVGATHDGHRAVGDAATIGEVSELIDRASALEAEVLEQFEVGSLAEDGGCEPARALDELGGQVALVQGHGNAVWLCRYLSYGVANTAIVTPIVTRCDNEQAILDVKKWIAHDDFVLGQISIYTYLNAKIRKNAGKLLNLHQILGLFMKKTTFITVIISSSVSRYSKG